MNVKNSITLRLQEECKKTSVHGLNIWINNIKIKIRQLFKLMKKMLKYI